MDVDTELRNARSALRQARTAVPSSPLVKQDPDRAIGILLSAVEHLLEAVEQMAKQRRPPF